MDKRCIFRSHQHRARGGRRRVDTSGPNGQGPCPAVAGSGWQIPRANGEGGTKVVATRPKSSSPHCPEKPLSDDVLVPVPQTDTGRVVEDTKAIERPLVKELGKLTPY